MASREEKLRARSARVIVDRLGLPSNPTWDLIIQKIEAHFGKTVALHSIEDGEWATTTALLIESETAGHIFYRATDPPLYQQHSIFHEFGHILLEEADCEILDVIPRELVEAAGVRESIVRAAARGLEVGEHELMAEAIAYALAKTLMRAQESALGL